MDKKEESASRYITRHISKSKGDIVDALAEWFQNTDSETAQIFTHGPKTKSLNKFNADALRAVCGKRRIYVHSTYLTSWSKEVNHISDQYEFAKSVGAAGLVLHLAKISPTDHLSVLKKLDLVDSCTVFLEMRALRPDRYTYQTVTEINELIEAIYVAKISHMKIAVCVDTAHLSAGGIRIETSRDVLDYLEAIKRPEYIRLLHLNGNQYDPRIRAGDKHCVPQSNLDKIWSHVRLRDSGAYAFANWFTARKLDVIMEIDDSEAARDFRANLVRALDC